MPATPGMGPLTHVPAEIARVRGHLPDRLLLWADARHPGDSGDFGDHPGEPGPDAVAPTKAAVLDALPGCPIAHFACHAAADASDPSASRLFLHDHLDDPLTVAGLTLLRLDTARLVYLSACQTALGHSEDLLDEAIHLASAFQLAGYPHVIATLWEVNDRVAATAADLFYGRLRGPDGRLDVDRAADALHHTVRDLRDRYQVVPGVWAAYLHARA